MISKFLHIAVGTAMATIVLFAGPRAAAQGTAACSPNADKPTCNPCAIFEDLIAKIASLGTLGLDLDPALASFINLLSADVADLDGDFLIDNSGDSLIATLSGDDIRDVSNQMELLEAVMRNAPVGLPFTSAQVKAAIVANEGKIRDKIGRNNPNMTILNLGAPSLVPALTFLTLLGKESDFAVIESEDPIKTHGSGTLGVLRALLVFLSSVEISEGSPLNFADTTVNPGEFITFGDFVGADADLDGDGYSNICEYRHFARNYCPKAVKKDAPFVDSTKTFIQAAMDPTITPTGCFEILNEEDDCTVNLNSSAVVPPSTSSAFGSARFRRFENTVTHAERFQMNLIHTVETEKPSAQIRKGLPGVAGTEVLVNLPDAGPIYWENFISAETAALLRRTPNYISIFGTDGNPPVTTEWLRADNSCGVLAPPPPVPHDADSNDNFIIELPEILGVVQLVNSNGFGCGPNFTYVPGGTDHSCQPHDSDYNPQDWKITLPELLRLVQLFTAGEYEQCIGGSEDGYCPLVP